MTPRRGRPELLVGRFGPEARRWKGDEASYTAKHMWIAKHYGKADYCEVDRQHVGKRYEWANISGEYRRDRSDYRKLCVPCHRRMDMAIKCRNGHIRSSKNTVIRKNYRICKVCRSDAQRRYIRRKREQDN